MKERAHNFTYFTGWKIIDENGNVRETSEDKNNCTVEGKLKIEILDSDKETVIEEHEQSFRSFIAGFLRELVEGYRVGKHDASYSTAPLMLSNGLITSKSTNTGADSTTVNNNLQKRMNVYVDNTNFSYGCRLSTVSSATDRPYKFNYNNYGIDSNAEQIYLETIEQSPNGVINIVLSSIQEITGGSGYIHEVGLYSDNNIMIAKDILTNDIYYETGKFVRIIWKIYVPYSNSKVITKNWIYNWVQNLTDSYTFKNINGTIVNGTQFTQSTQSFTKASNLYCEEGAVDENDNDISDICGIIVGSSNDAVSWDDYNLKSKINNGESYGQLLYKTSQIPTNIPEILYDEGSAQVTFFRHFTNHTNGNITIREAGIVAKTDVTTEGIDTAGSYLLARWLTGDVIVKPNETLVVYWQPTVFADSPTKSINFDNIIIVNETTRRNNPALKNISMIQRVIQNKRTWYKAKEYTYLTNSNGIKNIEGYGGYTDWRLPIQDGSGTSHSDEKCELKTIWDLYRTSNVLTNKFINNDNTTPGWSDYVWSDNESASDTSLTWRVYSAGNLNANSKTNSAYVFCVR